MTINRVKVERVLPGIKIQFRFCFVSLYNEASLETICEFLS
jgi:hypothetical protein